jgi:DNA-binding MarR family transcriptional regulator
MSGTDMPDPTADPVVDALLRANRALVAITARSLSAVNADVTLAQFRSLVVLATAGPQTVSALADRLAVHASTMTRMCNRLVARGLVVRAPSAVDRREVVIALTSMGTSVVEKVMTARRKELDEVMRRMGEDDRSAVVVALDKFAQAAGVTPNSSSDPQLSVAGAARQILEES